MQKPTCSVESCEREGDKRGWCNAHYLRNYRYGDPLATAPKPTTQERFHLGYFDDVAKAEAAAIAKRLELFTHNDADRRLSAAGSRPHQQ